jgi:hypothetical protein
MKKITLLLLFLVVGCSSLVWGEEKPPATHGEDLGKPRLVVQTGHPFFVSSVAFSPDSSTALSGSWDKAEAIRQAKLKLKEEKGHPFFGGPLFW